MFFLCSLHQMRCAVSLYQKCFVCVAYIRCVVRLTYTRSVFCVCSLHQMCCTVSLYRKRCVAACFIITGKQSYWQKLQNLLHCRPNRTEHNKNKQTVSSGTWVCLLCYCFTFVWTINGTRRRPLRRMVTSSPGSVISTQSSRTQLNNKILWTKQRNK